ncbi:MAG: T9SS type A sorting domain-containing protein [Chlorobi bacterium]|nr:T9SS type A sorting domain-containing protein [Chlorobiota bacterium]
MKALYTFLISCFCVSLTLAQSNIASLEYFFDTDPGVGLATSIDINPDAALVNQSFSIPTSGLTIGTHRLFIRTINFNGDASFYEHKTFRIAPTSENNTANIIEAEYFIDQDPGVGLATFANVINGAVVNETLTIPTGSLSLGTHRLFVRVKNSNNQWSLYEHKTFRVAPASDVNAATITAAEYFIDADPGFGMATPLAVNGDVLDKNLIIPTSTDLAQGDHYLHIRIQNADGTWSLYEIQMFTLNGILSVNSETLAEIKLFPNPTSDYINISMPNGNQITNAVLYDLNGKQVYQSTNQLEKINISSFSIGTYLLLLETKKGSISKKIIKN